MIQGVFGNQDEKKRIGRNTVGNDKMHRK